MIGSIIIIFWAYEMAPFSNTGSPQFPPSNALFEVWRGLVKNLKPQKDAPHCGAFGGVFGVFSGFDGAEK